MNDEFSFPKIPEITVLIRKDTEIDRETWAAIGRRMGWTLSPASVTLDGFDEKRLTRLFDAANPKEKP